MRPTRAAWFFAAGIAWLVLRGILVDAFPLLRSEQALRQGGLLLVVPLTSIVASMTAPLFFLSFLRSHRFEDQRGMRSATVVAAAASLLSFLLVLIFFVFILRGVGAGNAPSLLSSPWLLQGISLVFVGSLFLFLVVFSRQCRCPRSLRKAAAVAALGALISTVMIAAWVLFSRLGGGPGWYLAFSQSLIAKVLGLAAAGMLLWFLEAFATTYDGGVEGPEEH